MEYKEPKKRVTKNDKKNKKQVYSQKHVAKKNDGSLHPTQCSLFPNGRL